MEEPKILLDLEFDVNENCERRIEPLLVHLSRDRMINEVEVFCQVFRSLSTWYFSPKYYSNFLFGCLCSTHFNLLYILHINNELHLG
jgi:hypothetical protein